MDLRGFFIYKYTSHFFLFLVTQKLSNLETYKEKLLASPDSSGILFPAPLAGKKI
jgi:hypothetical protein